MAKHKPQSTTNETYMLMSHLFLSFFDKVGFYHPEDKRPMQYVNDKIKEMEKEWIEYDIKYSR